MRLYPRTCAAGAAALLALIAAGCTATPSDSPETVEQVDLERYAGRWYEIARIPNRFQDQCAGGTTAEYSLRDDGRIGVLNRCVTEDGDIDEARGVARVADPQTNARLEVSFVDLLGWQLFWGDYWILGLGPDYGWSLVGHPQRRYGWILSRTPSISPATRARIDELLRDNGYDAGRFVDSPRAPDSHAPRARANGARDQKR